LSFGLQDALRGNAYVIVCPKRFVNEVAELIVLEEIEPLHISERGRARLRLARAKLRGR
jgi:hypothetical protein